MINFSEKYKASVDEKQISPDFKERTFAKMTAIRDSKVRKKSCIPMLCTGIAAVACFALIFVLGQPSDISDDGVAEYSGEVAEITSAQTRSVVSREPENDVENAELYADTEKFGEDAPQEEGAFSVTTAATVADEIVPSVQEEPSTSFQSCSEADVITQADELTLEVAEFVPPLSLQPVYDDTFSDSDDENEDAVEDDAEMDIIFPEFAGASVVEHSSLPDISADATAKIFCTDETISLDANDTAELWNGFLRLTQGRISRDRSEYDGEEEYTAVFEGEQGITLRAFIGRYFVRFEALDCEDYDACLYDISEEEYSALEELIKSFSVTS